MARGRRRAYRPSEEERAAISEQRRNARESVKAPRPPWATYWCKAQDGPEPSKENKDQPAVVRADFVKGARRG